MRLSSIWKGTEDDEYASAAIIGTAAIALCLTGKADDIEQAIKLSGSMWKNRDKTKY